MRLLQVDFFDPTCHEFVPEVIYEGERFGLQEGSIARYLGLGKGNVSELKFRDNTDTLYVTNTHQLTTKS